ncbi:MAG: element excision factor XisH family protein [Nostocaceae cyanobacterium]|nr:element excision factor XisH family protein [Nostocaceae cyanobacterium]
MPKLDIIHNTVKNALIKDNWVIIDDPYIYLRQFCKAPTGCRRGAASLYEKAYAYVE